MSKETEVEVKLDSQLVEVIESLGDTPFLEKEIAKLFDENAKKSAVINEALKKSDLTIDSLDALQMGAFYHFIETRIFELKREDGFFKETEKTANINMPSFMETEELMEISMEVVGLKENEKEYEEKNNEFIDRIFEIAKVKKDELSEWEQSLVIGQVRERIMGAVNASVGVHVKK